MLYDKRLSSLKEKIIAEAEDELTAIEKQKTKTKKEGELVEPTSKKFYKVKDKKYGKK